MMREGGGEGRVKKGDGRPVSRLLCSKFGRTMLGGHGGGMRFTIFLGLRVRQYSGVCSWTTVHVQLNLHYEDKSLLN